jgi:hypothetical protein
MDPPWAERERAGPQKGVMWRERTRRVRVFEGPRPSLVLSVPCYMVETARSWSPSRWGRVERHLNELRR